MTRRVALVLGAGGVAGHAFHAGLLAALERETGWDPREADLVLGTSAGSVVGLALRAGLSAADIFARAVDEPLSSEGQRVLALLPPPADGWTLISSGPRIPFPASPRLVARVATRPWTVRPGVALAGLVPPGRYDVSRIGEEVDLLVGSLPRPIRGLWTTAVRLADGRRVIFGRQGDGSAASLGEWTWGQAVAASCAIPGFFRPVVIGGESFVDGGAHSPTHADLVAESRPDLVIVSSPMSAVRANGRRGLDAPIRTMYRWRLAAEVGRLRRNGVPVVVFQPTAEVLAAAGLNAMSGTVRAPVARATLNAVTSRCRRSDFTPHARLLVA